ncbi:MAG: GlcG protein [Rhodospirillaceae bacterium TMED8]|nr:GlcG protein [Magnetovibrio sp.]OUT47787.1 MAG: GlcG protein [Rhodospirillaceae bacterium TMED8]|tara:strand:+ start:3961 stop:4389 length:429 start_codon:yes stop_codon:yes gene_type:complete
MSKLNLEKANIIVRSALNKGADLKLKPLTVVVLDAGGHFIVVNRQDGSGIVRVEVATGKAWISLGTGLPSGKLDARDIKFLSALNGAANGRCVPVPGGVLVCDPETDEIIGSVGISGDTSEQDEACAIAGIKAAELKPLGTI